MARHPAKKVSSPRRLSRRTRVFWSAAFERRFLSGGPALGKRTKAAMNRHTQKRIRRKRTKAALRHCTPKPRKERREQSPPRKQGSEVVHPQFRRQSPARRLRDQPGVFLRLH